MEDGNITKAATLKSFIHQSYKKHTTTFSVDIALQYFHETNINRLVWGVAQKYELRVSFK